MRAKTLFIVIITAAVTAILVNNTSEMELWVFGSHKFPKLGVLGAMLALGFVLGLVIGKGSSKKTTKFEIDDRRESEEDDETVPFLKKTSTLSDEDRDYIS